MSRHLTSIVYPCMQLRHMVLKCLEFSRLLLKQEMQRKREQEEMSECTFKPRLISQKR